MSSIYDYLPAPELKQGASARRAPRILVVDDQPINVKLLERKLEREGMVPLLAENGRQCVEIARAELPDLILLDVMMPEMDGIEACRLLHANPQTREIPIIFITARSGKEGKLEGFDAGAVDYIVKPIDLEETMARVRTHLQMREYHRENLALQRRLSEVRRQALVGQLTLGLSHNLNNLLGIVVGYLDLMKSAPDNKPMVERGMAGMDNGLRRIGALISQVLKLGENGRPDVHDIRVGDILSSAVTAFRAQGEFKGEIDVSVGAVDGAIFRTDASLVVPALVSLLGNAEESAMRIPGNVPHLKLTAMFKDTSAGRVLLLSIKDNGTGIDRTVADAIFQPFISVKSEVGAGFGLPLAQQGVERLGGSLTLENHPEGGAVATISLPVMDFAPLPFSRA